MPSEEKALVVSLGKAAAAELYVSDEADAADPLSEPTVVDESSAEEVSLSKATDVASALLAESVSSVITERRLLLLDAVDAVVSVALAYEEKELVMELTETPIMILRSITTLEAVLF